MSRMRQIAALIYGINALISIVLGSVYVLRDQFMPYHASALKMDWAQLDAATQTLILALMDVAGAGWAVTGVLLFILVIIPFRAGARWARWTVPVALVVLYVPILMATLSVMANTDASPPWYGNAIALLTTAIGLAFDQPWRHEAKPNASSQIIGHS